MAQFGFLIVAFCFMLFQFRQVVAPPPPIIEAYKPTNGATTTVQDANSGFGILNKLRDMLTKLQHKIDDIDVQRKFMEAQMKSPFGILPNRMEAALDYTDTSQPSFEYQKQIVSRTGVFLQIFPDGAANGTRDPTSPYGKAMVYQFIKNHFFTVSDEIKSLQTKIPFRTVYLPKILKICR